MSTTIKTFAKRQMQLINGQQFVPHDVFRSFITEVGKQFESASTDESLASLETRLAGLTGRVTDAETGVSANRSVIEMIASSIEELAQQVQLLKQRMFISDNTLYITDGDKTYGVSVDEAFFLPKVTIKRGWKYLRSAEDDLMLGYYQKAWKLYETDAIGVSETLQTLYSRNENIVVGDKLYSLIGDNIYSTNDSNTITAIEMMPVQNEENTTPANAPASDNVGGGEP